MAKVNKNMKIAIVINSLLVADKMWKYAIDDGDMDSTRIWREAYYEAISKLDSLGIPYSTMMNSKGEK